MILKGKSDGKDDALELRCVALIIDLNSHYCLKYLSFVREIIPGARCVLDRDCYQVTLVMPDEWHSRHCLEPQALRVLDVEKVRKLLELGLKIFEVLINCVGQAVCI